MLSLVLFLGACAPGSSVSVSPHAWPERLEHARPGGHDALLAELRLRPVTSVDWRPPTLEQVEVRAVDLSDAPKDELLVRAVFTSELAPERGPPFPSGVRLYRVQVLRAEGQGWCALDTGLLSRDDVLETANAGPADGMKDTLGPLFLELVHFNHPKRWALHVWQRFETFSRSSASGERHEWWEVVDGRVAPVLSLEKASGTNRFAEDGLLWSSWFELRGKPPVRVFRFSSACDGPDAGCRTSQTELLRHDGGWVE